MDRTRAILEHKRHERGRWEMLRCLHVGGHVGTTDTMILSVLVALWAGVTRDWVRDQLAYLEDRKLVRIERHAVEDWRCWLTRDGTDVVLYTVDCLPGIDRPHKYWGGE